MGTKHYTFRSYEDDVDAGQYVKYEVDPGEFKIDESCSINSAAYISKEGEVFVVTSAWGKPEGNFIACDVPIEIKTGEYKLKVSVVSLSKPEDTAIIESYVYFNINGIEDKDAPPEIKTLHFTLHQAVIPVADLTSDTLAIMGKHLRHVTSIKILSPSVFFNIIFHDNEYIKARAISVPRVQGLRLVYPIVEYTIKNKLK